MKGDCQYLCNPEYVVNVFFMIYTLCLYWFTLFRKRSYSFKHTFYVDYILEIFIVLFFSFFEIDNPWSVLLNESRVRNNDRIVNFQVNYPRHVHTN